MLKRPDAIRVIVYDLDGTVYDDNRHFELYAREIQSYLPVERQEPFWADYSAVVEGRHPALRIGTFYDRQQDLVLETRAGQVRRALHWDGSAVPEGELRSLYPNPVEPDNKELLNVGDLWWVPSAVAGHFGGDPANNNKAFLRIREIMSEPSFAMRPIPGLKELIQSLKGRVVQVLATNSPQPDSEAILTKIGLLELFDHLSFNSKKPAGLKRLFDQLASRHGVTMDQILSVGDNLVNEITPAKAMGCQTVFIDPHKMSQPDDADLIVGSMTELMPILSQMGR